MVGTLTALLMALQNKRMEVPDMKKRANPGGAYKLLQGFGFKVDQ